MFTPQLTIILPCYNEQGVLLQTIPVILNKLNQLIEQKSINENSHLLLVDDGSKDETWLEISQLVQQFQPHIKALKLTRNFGHQNAVFAGMMYVLHVLKSDICISMDCDLQDDPNILGEMVTQFMAGNEIVYAVRHSRHKDSLAKRGFAQNYYRILRALRIDIVPDHADYRLLSMKALQALEQFGESSLFLRGMVPLLGYPHSKVYYQRDERAAGYSKYDIPRMIRLAINGVCSFSSAPLMFILYLGILISLFSLLLGIWALGVKWFGDGIVPGWASTVVPMYFLGGIQLFTLGVVGIYVGKIFDEVKRRPKYLIEKEL